MSLINVHQDMAMILIELNQFDKAIEHADILIESIKKSLNKNYNASHTFNFAMQLKEIATKKKELALMHPVKRFKVEHPYAFYTAAVGLFAGIAGATFMFMKKQQ